MPCLSLKHTHFYCVLFHTHLVHRLVCDSHAMVSRSVVCPICLSVTYYMCTECLLVSRTLCLVILQWPQHLKHLLGMLVLCLNVFASSLLCLSDIDCGYSIMAMPEGELCSVCDFFFCVKAMMDLHYAVAILLHCLPWVYVQIVSVTDGLCPYREIRQNVSVLQQMSQSSLSTNTSGVGIDSVGCVS